MAKHHSGGRKGYEFEEKEIKKMREFLGEYFDVIEKLFKVFKKSFKSGKALKELEKIKIEYLRELIKIGNKILDKLHANRQEVKVQAEITFNPYEKLSDKEFEERVRRLLKSIGSKKRKA